MYGGSSNIWLTCLPLSTNPFFPHTGVRTIQKPVVFGQAGFQSPSPHSSRGFAARLIVGSAAKTLFRVRLQSRQLRRLLKKQNGLH